MYCMTTYFVLFLRNNTYFVLFLRNNGFEMNSKKQEMSNFEIQIIHEKPYNLGYT
jgi:hypothetical protein